MHFHAADPDDVGAIEVADGNSRQISSAFAQTPSFDDDACSLAKLSELR